MTPMFDPVVLQVRHGREVRDELTRVGFGPS